RRRIAWLRATWPEQPSFAGLAIGHEEAERLASPDPAFAATAFGEEDPAAIAAAEEVESLDAELAELRADPTAYAPVLALASALGLDGFEMSIFSLVLCSELDPGFGRLCAYLQDDA